MPPFAIAHSTWVIDLDDPQIGFLDSPVNPTCRITGPARSISVGHRFHRVSLWFSPRGNAVPFPLGNRFFSTEGKRTTELASRKACPGVGGLRCWKTKAAA